MKINEIFSYEKSAVGTNVICYVEYSTGNSGCLALVVDKMSALLGLWGRESGSVVSEQFISALAEHGALDAKVPFDLPFIFHDHNL